MRGGREEARPDGGGEGSSPLISAMDFRASCVLFGLLLSGACYSSHSLPDDASGDASVQDASIQDAGVTDTSVPDSTPGEDASTCRGPADWRIDVPAAAFMHASATADGWRISGAAEAPLDTSTSWLSDRDGALSERSELVDTPWGAASGGVFAGDRDGTIHIGRFTESGEAVWRGEYAHGQTMRTLEVIEDGRAAYVVGTMTNADGDRDALVARFDESGTLEWAQVFDRGAEPSSEWVIGAFIDAAGRLVVANHVYLGLGVGDPVPVWVFALSADSELAWEHVEDGYGPASSWGLVHDDAGMFLVGTLAHFDVRGGLQTMRLSTEGEVLWTRRVDDGSERRHEVRGAIPTPDGGYLLAGRISGAVGGGPGGGGQVWKLNAAGELLWTASPGDFRTSITNMAAFEDGYILVSQNHVNERTWMAFVGIGQDGVVRWRHEEEGLRNRVGISDMVPNDRGEVLAVGFSTEGPNRLATAIQFGQRCRR